MRGQQLKANTFVCLNYNNKINTYWSVTEVEYSFQIGLGNGIINLEVFTFLFLLKDEVRSSFFYISVVESYVLMLPLKVIILSLSNISLNHLPIIWRFFSLWNEIEHGCGSYLLQIFIIILSLIL